MFKRLIRSISSLIVPVVATGLIVSASQTASALTIEVAQESSFMAADWDSNIIGHIAPFDTGLATAGFYSFGSPNPFSYNGDSNGGPAPVPEMTQMFFVNASDGLSFFVVHDAVADGSGGNAAMRLLLTGDTAAIFSDDPGDFTSSSIVVGGQRFDTDHVWRVCCTDGFVIATLDTLDWELFGRFDQMPTNISGWQVLTGTGDAPVELDFTRQRVRFRIVSVPEPATAGLLAIALAGLGIARRLRRKGTA